MSINKLIVSVGVLLFLAVPTFAQQGQGPGQGQGPQGQGGFGGPGGGGPGGQGNFQIDPAMAKQFMDRIQQQALDNIKTQLGSSDDEFVILSPKLQKLLQFQIGNFRGMASMMMGRQQGQMLNSIFGQGQSTVQKATDDLQSTLDDPNASEGAIETKLAALRIAKAQYQQDLRAAQDDVRQLLSVRQEGVLTELGLLD